MSLSVGTIAPDFTLVDNTLTSHTLSSYKGQNIVLAFFLLHLRVYVKKNYVHLEIIFLSYQQHMLKFLA